MHGQQNIKLGTDIFIVFRARSSTASLQELFFHWRCRRSNL